MACHWDLVGITGPRDPNTPKWACKTVKKLVINVDDLEDAGDKAPSPAMDLAASAFAVRNVANALVTESASIWGTFIRFHEQITTSLDRMMEVLVKEQAAAQKDCFASFKLLERIAEALERSSPRQVGVVPTERPVVGGMEAVPVVERVQTPLFLMDSDPMDLPFALEADKDSGCGSENEGIGHGNERGGDENEGRGNKDKESRSEDGSFDGNTMVE
jgi:hypothetical protein